MSQRSAARCSAVQCTVAHWLLCLDGVVPKKRPGRVQDAPTKAARSKPKVGCSTAVLSGTPQKHICVMQCEVTRASCARLQCPKKNPPQNRCAVPVLHYALRQRRLRPSGSQYPCCRKCYHLEALGWVRGPDYGVKLISPPCCFKIG